MRSHCYSKCAAESFIFAAKSPSRLHDHQNTRPEIPRDHIRIARIRLANASSKRQQVLIHRTTRTTPGTDSSRPPPTRIAACEPLDKSAFDRNVLSRPGRHTTTIQNPRRRHSTPFTFASDTTRPDRDKRVDHRHQSLVAANIRAQETNLE